MNMRIALIGIVLAGLLASCAPAAPSPGSSAGATAVAGTSTAGNATSIAPTAIASGTQPPSMPPGGLSPTELKYRLLDQFPDFFYCDPDTYPVAKADETQLAIQHFPEIQANAAEFQSILQHTGLGNLGSFTVAQKLQIYRDYKRLAAIPLEPASGAYQFELTTSDGGQGLLVKGFIDDGGRISVSSKAPTVATCPICLAAWTMIDTPSGPVPVTDLKAGDIVWTQDVSGKRVPAPVLQVASVQVPPTHEMVHVVLADGRQVWASAGHPTADGRRLGELRTGEALDGSHIVRLERTPYEAGATYDLLPAGGTGHYWADGILLGSTLARP